MIRVGTAGYAYKDWEGIVYPAPKPRGFDALAYLAGFFDCVEMNVTFYRVPEARHVERWLESVEGRPDFRFTFKLYQGLTHGEEDEALAPYLDALRPCAERSRLGAILLQFPHFFANDERSRRRLASLAERLAGWPCAVELRHRSWITRPALDFLRALGLSLCDIDVCASATSVPAGSWTTGPIGYVRLHGRNAKAWFDRTAPVWKKYDYLYSAEELESWIGLAREIEAKTGNTYVVTNNHFEGKSVANAFQLARALLGRAPAPPPHLSRRYPALA